MQTPFPTVSDVRMFFRIAKSLFATGERIELSVYQSEVFNQNLGVSEKVYAKVEIRGYLSNDEARRVRDEENCKQQIQDVLDEIDVTKPLATEN